MLYKDLKKTVFEAEENINNTATQTSNTNNTPIKPQKDVKNIKDASDGIENESYTFSTDMAVALIKTLKQYYNVYDINVENNLIIIKNNLKKTSSPDVITSRLSGKPVENDSIINTIQMIITSAAEGEIDNFSLEGPISDGNGLLTIMVKYTPKTK